MVVGVTGGIGSGKSIVCSIFLKFGIPVYQSDLAAHAIYDQHPELIDFIKNEISQEAIDKNGKLNRRKLGEIVFNDINKLDLLNSKVHPIVKEDFLKWKKINKNSDFVIKETAILFESGSDADCDKIIVVVSTPDLRFNRLKLRDNKSKSEVEKIMTRQLSDDELINKSDFVVYNNEEQLVIPQVIRIYNLLKDKTSK